MNPIDVIRAWKNPKFRRSLGADQLAALPANPAGLVELSDEDLLNASGLGGGAKPPPQTTAITCTMYSFLNWQACGCGPATTAPTCTAYSFQGWKACCP